MHRFLLLGCLFLLLSGVALGQSRPFIECATPPLTPAQRAILRAQPPGGGGGQHRIAALTYVPITLHVVRATNGTGGTAPADIYRALVYANQRFAAMGVQFYVCGQIDYVNSTTLLNYDFSEENTLCDPRDVAGTFNMYFVDGITVSGSTACGYAYLALPGFSVVRRLLIGCTTLRTVTHELGHTFGLFHTFESNTSPDPADVERVDGSNCTTAGDLVCDTPADPYGRSGASTSGVCTYTGSVTDPAGDTYAPQLDNLMSYWRCRGRLAVTPGQEARAADTYQQLHAGNVGCTAPAPATPTGLTATAQPGSAVGLTWTDVATTELGYFIERADGPGAEFITIGYTLPNATAWTDLAPPAGVAARYRVKPINAVGGFSGVVTHTTAQSWCAPLYSESNCGANAATYLQSVQLSQGTAVILNNPASGCGDYTLFTTPTGSLQASTAYTLRVDLPAGQQQFVAAWLDYNRNGSFADAGEQVYAGTISTTPQTATFTTPAALGSGPIRFRVRSQGQPDGPLSDACVSANTGETEDYLLTPCALAAPAVAITTPQPACAGTALTLVATGVPAGATYQWTGPNSFSSTQPSPTIASATAAASGTYHLTITVGSCTASATVAASVQALPAATATASGPLALCPSGSVVLTAGGGGAGATYQWRRNGTAISGATGLTHTATQAGSYSVRVTNAAGCVATSAALAVTVNPAPTVTVAATGAPAICQGDSVRLTASGAASYVWSTGATTAVIWVQQAGTYSVTGTSAAGCSATSAPVAVTVTLPPSAAFAFSQPTYCQGVGGPSPTPTILGMAGGSFSASAAGLVLDSLTGAVDLLTSQPGTYTVTYTVPGTCPATATRSITLQAPPVATLAANGPPTICAGDTLLLTASPGAQVQFNLNGQPIVGATGSIYAATQPGAYSVTVTNAATCSATSAPLTVTVKPVPAVPVVTQRAFGNGLVILSATSTVVGATYQWLLNGQPVAGATDSTLTISTQAQSGAYTVVLTSGVGCSATSAPVTIAVTGTARSAETVAVSLFPNPVPSGDELTITGEGLVEVTITDAAGRVVSRASGAGLASLVLAAPRTAGIYVVRIRTLGGVVKRRLAVFGGRN